MPGGEAQVGQVFLLLLVLLCSQEFPPLDPLAIDFFLRVLNLVEVQQTGGIRVLGVHGLVVFFLRHEEVCCVPCASKGCHVVSND